MSQETVEYINEEPDGTVGWAMLAAAAPQLMQQFSQGQGAASQARQQRSQANNRALMSLMTRMNSRPKNSRVRVKRLRTTSRDANIQSDSPAPVTTDTPKKDNTTLYVIGAVAVLGVGTIIFMSSGRKK